MSHDLDTTRQLATLDPKAQARCAIHYTLDRIKHDPHLAWYCGLGTQTFSLLTEVLATIDDVPVETVRKAFRPPSAVNPAEQRVEGNADTLACQTIDDALDAERKALRQPIIDLLNLYPCLQGIAWHAAEPEQLMEILRTHVERDRRAMESIR